MILDGQGDEHLQRAAALLLGEEAHRQHGDDDQREPAGGHREHLRERGPVTLPEVIHEEEKDAQHDQPEADHDVGQR